MDILNEKNILFMNPFLSLNNKEKLKKRLLEELGSLNISKAEINEAVEAAWQERLNFI